VFGRQALTTISAARLVAPITLVGLTALSVLISTKRSTPCLGRGQRRVVGAQRVVAQRRQALWSSISGTCL
jgi:hypothetical protein